MEGWVRGDEVEGWWWFGREGQGETREGSSRLGRGRELGLPTRRMPPAARNEPPGTALTCPLFTTSSHSPQQASPISLFKMADQNKKALVWNMLDFLKTSVADGSVKSDDVEGLEVASASTSSSAGDPERKARRLTGDPLLVGCFQSSASPRPLASIPTRKASSTRSSRPASSRSLMSSSGPSRARRWARYVSGSHSKAVARV
jgi:hypothetical protein